MKSNIDRSAELFSYWFEEEDYGSFGGTRSLYCFDEIKTGANASRIKTWLEAAFQAGYIHGVLSKSDTDAQVKTDD